MIQAPPAEPSRTAAVPDPPVTTAMRRPLRRELPPALPVTSESSGRS